MKGNLKTRSGCSYILAIWIFLHVIHAKETNEDDTTIATCTDTVKEDYTTDSSGRSARQFCDNVCRYKYLNIVNITTVCSSVNFKTTALPNNHKDTTKKYKHYLIITNSTIQWLNISAFINYPNVIKLNMINIHLQKISPNAYKSLLYLEQISLSDNDLSDIGEGIFNSLTSLKYLDLSKNKIKSVGLHAFTGTSLEVLNLSANALIDFDCHFFYYLTEIITIDFSCIPSKLNYLNVSDNLVSKATICLDTLIELNINNNQLTSLKNFTASQAPHLEKFDVSYNGISESDLKILSNLKMLTHLSLHHNKITSLPNLWFSNLGNLIFLNLSYNQIDQLQYGLLDRSRNLEILDLSHNNLYSIKIYNIHANDELLELYIHNNKISTLNAKQLSQHLPNLRIISLNNNLFSCHELVDIIYNFEVIGTTILHGNSVNNSNILGIACQETEFGSGDINQETVGQRANIDDGLRTKLNQFFNNDFSKSVMYNYFNKDFKNSAFHKYLESLKDNKLFDFNSNITAIYKYLDKDFKDTQFFKYLENMKRDDIVRSEFNKSVYNYFENDFKNSNFVKFLDNLRKADDVINNDFSKSSMYTYFNKEFKNSNFYKYLENLRSSQYLAKYSVNGNETKAEKLIQYSEEKNDSSGLLIPILLVLIMILGLRALTLYLKFFKPTNNNQSVTEHVELLET